MGAMANGGPEGVLRRVVHREHTPNFSRDKLECGHEVADYDNRELARRRCLARAEVEAQPAPVKHCLACGAVVPDGGDWCDPSCGREVLLALYGAGFSGREEG